MERGSNTQEGFGPRGFFSGCSARIIAAAEAWLAAHPDDINCDMRFDVILVAPKSIPRHITAAFDASH